MNKRRTRLEAVVVFFVASTTTTPEVRSPLGLAEIEPLGSLLQLLCAGDAKTCEPYSEHLHGAPLSHLS